MGRFRDRLSFDFRRLLTVSKMPPEQELERFVRRWLPWLALAALLVGGIVMAVQLWPDAIPRKKDPGFLDNIFASRLIVWTMRMLLFVGVLYAAGSIVHLISQNRWLSDFGPFKVSEKVVDELEQRVQSGAEELEKQAEQAAELAKRLERRDREVVKLVKERDALRDQLRDQVDNAQRKPEE